MVLKPSKEFLQEALTNNSFDIDSTDKALRKTLDHSFSYLYRLQRNMVCYEEYFYTSRNEIEQPDFGDFYMDPRERICVNLPAALVPTQYREKFRTSKHYRKKIAYKELCTDHALFTRMPIITIDNRVVRNFDITIHDDFFTAHLPFDRYFLHTKKFDNRRWEYYFVEHDTSLQVINNSSFTDIVTNTGMLQANSYNKLEYDRLLQSYLSDLGAKVKESDKGSYFATLFFGDDVLGTQLQVVSFDTVGDVLIHYDADVLDTLRNYRGQLTIRFYFYKFLHPYGKMVGDRQLKWKPIETRIRDSKLISEIFIIQNHNRETKKNYLLPIPTENLLLFRIDNTKDYGGESYGSAIHYPNTNVDISYPNIYRIQRNISFGDKFRIFYFYMPPYDLQYEYMYWFMYNFMTYKWEDASLEETVNRVFFREMNYDLPGFRNKVGDKKIQAYTGVFDERYKPEYIIDTDKTTDDTDKRWESGVQMKVGGFTPANGGSPVMGEPMKDAVSYIVIDMGYYMLKHLSEIRIQWDNYSYATEYKIQVSDTCRKKDDVGDEITTKDITYDVDPWEDIAVVSGVNHGILTPYKEDVLNGDQLLHKYLRRYVRILITKMNLASQTAHPAIREVSFVYDMEISRVDIIWLFKHMIRKGNKAVLVDSSTPSYGTEFSTPHTKDDAEYHITCTFGVWEQLEQGSSVWTPAENIYFDFDRQYRGTFVVQSTEKVFSDDVVVQINGSTDNVSVQRVNDHELEICLTFDALVSYESLYQRIREWFSGSEGVEIIDRFKEGQKDAADRPWEDFVEIYYYFAEYLCRSVKNEEAVDVLVAPRWYRYEDLENGRSELIAAYKKLSCIDPVVMERSNYIEVSVPEPADGVSQVNATVPSVETLLVYPNTLTVSQSMNGRYFIDKDGSISGRITFDNDSVLDLTGNAEFIMSMELYVPEPCEHVQYIIGKMDQQYGLQIKNGKLITYGCLDWQFWHQVEFSIPDDGWYGIWHDVVCIYTGRKFMMYVDGIAAVETPGYELRSGDLVSWESSKFTIGYKWNDGSTGDPDFTGLIKNIYILREGLTTISNPYPDWRSIVTTAEVPSKIRKALKEAIISATPLVTIGGSLAKYDITDTRWEPYDVVFDPYKEYSVEIDVQTIPRDGQDFKFDVTDKGNLFKLNGLLVPLDNIRLSKHGGMATIQKVYPGREKPEKQPPTKVESFEDVFDFTINHKIVDYFYDEIDYLRKHAHLHPFEYKVGKLKEFIKKDWEALRSYVFAQNKVGIKYEFSAKKVDLEKRYCVQMETGDPLPEPMYLFPVEKPNPNRILSARIFIDGLLCSTFIYDRYQFTDMIYIPVSQVSEESYFEIEVFPAYTEKHLVTFTEDKPYIEIDYPSVKAIAPTMSDLYFYFGKEDTLDRIEKEKFDIEVISTEYNYYVNTDEITIYFKTNSDGNIVKGQYYDENGHCYSFEGQPLHEKDITVDEMHDRITSGELKPSTGYSTDDHLPVIRATDIVTYDRVALGEPIHLPNDKGIIYSWITKIRITPNDPSVYDELMTIGIAKEPAFRSGRVSGIDYPYYITQIENTQDVEEYTRVFKNGRLMSKNRYDFNIINDFLGIQVLEQLVKGDTIAFDITPYRNRLVMYKRAITSDLVDLRGYINKPFDPKYYEVYLNGRRLNRSNIYPISPWEFKLAGTHSVYHLEVYEKDRDWEYYGIHDWKYLTLSDFIRKPFVESDIADKLIEDITGPIPDTDNTEYPEEWDRILDIISVYFEIFYYMKLVPMHFVSGDQVNFEKSDIEKRYPIIDKLFYETNDLGENVLMLNPNIAHNPETTTPDKDGHEPWRIFMLGNPTLEGLDDENEWKGEENKE